MRLFICDHCRNLVYFENTRCERCGIALGYLPGADAMEALTPQQEGGFAGADGRALRLCDNARHDACNWVIPAESPDIFCAACRHNHTIPDLNDPEYLVQWRRMEVAKRRLFYTLFRLGLQPVARPDDPAGLAFDFLAEVPGGPKVMTGHEDGLIVIALNEADDAERERRRKEMGEPYRTLLGHFRHEVGHYFWDKLVRDGGRIDECRAVFGDDSQDYAAALQAHYASGPPPGWNENFVSEYATSHPWEDFAETWAHYLHIVDTLETASAFGLRVHPTVGEEFGLSARINFDPYQAESVEQLITPWLPLAFAMNSLNRSMGLSDLYPFVLPPAVIGKLGFIHGLIHPSPGQEQAKAA